MNVGKNVILPVPKPNDEFVQAYQRLLYIVGTESFLYWLAFNFIQEVIEDKNQYLEDIAISSSETNAISPDELFSIYYLPPNDLSEPIAKFILKDLQTVIITLANFYQHRPEIKSFIGQLLRSNCHLDIKSVISNSDDQDQNMLIATIRQH